MWLLNFDNKTIPSFLTFDKKIKDKIFQYQAKKLEIFENGSPHHFLAIQYHALLEY